VGLVLSQSHVINPKVDGLFLRKEKVSDDILVDALNLKEVANGVPRELY
jgi:hypothetical protein